MQARSGAVYEKQGMIRGKQLRRQILGGFQGTVKIVLQGFVFDFITWIQFKHTGAQLFHNSGKEILPQFMPGCMERKDLLRPISTDCFPQRRFILHHVNHLLCLLR